MPRALTEQEKQKQYRKILDKGKGVVLAQGVKKPSVDDISKAAGMTKGTFYQHFGSKEQFMYTLVMEMYQQTFGLAKQLLQNVENPQVAFRDFLTNLFFMPEMIFATKYHDEIQEIMESMASQEESAHLEQEENMYEQLLLLMGVDIEKVKPGVVHNYIHMVYAMMGSDLVMVDDLPETLDLLIENLIIYVFSGLNQG